LRLKFTKKILERVTNRADKAIFEPRDSVALAAAWSAYGMTTGNQHKLGIRLTYHTKVETMEPKFVSLSLRPVWAIAEVPYLLPLPSKDMNVRFLNGKKKKKTRMRNTWRVTNTS